MRNWASSHGADALNLSLSFSGLTTSLTSRLPRRDLGVVPLRVLALGRRPDAHDRLVRGLGDHVRRDLQGDRVDVVALERVVADLGEVPAVQQVEDAQVGEERVVGLAGERRRVVGKLVDRLVAQLLVVRHGGLADVRGRHRDVVGELRLVLDLLVLQLEQLDVVRLRDVQVGVVEALDRARVVQERLLVLDVRLEGEAVEQVALPVTVVVDVEVVLRVLGELVEVRAAAGLLEGDPVGDDRRRVGLVGADERVDVRVVVLGVARDQRGLPVTGGGGRPRFQRGHTGGCEPSGGQRSTYEGRETPASRATPGDRCHAVRPQSNLPDAR